MRRPFFLIFTNAMILIVVFALLTQSMVIVQHIAVTSKIMGRVEVQRSGRGETVLLTRGAPIKTGDVIHSDSSGSAEFKWADGTRWKIMPNTRIVVKKASFHSLRKADRVQLQLTSGQVFIRIVRSLTSNSTFEVETPTTVAAVRGTIFSVAVREGKTQVAVFKGHVQVSSPGISGAQQVMIDPGQVAISSNPGTVQTAKSTTSDAEFAQQPDLVKPALSADVRLLKDNKALITGSSEAGDKIAVNGQAVGILGNGTFRCRVPLRPGSNTFTITSVDRHGASSIITKTISGP